MLTSTRIPRTRPCPIPNPVTPTTRAATCSAAPGHRPSVTTNTDPFVLILAATALARLGDTSTPPSTLRFRVERLTGANSAAVMPSRGDDVGVPDRQSGDPVDRHRARVVARGHLWPGGLWPDR